MDYVQVVDPVGIAGGLGVLWKKDLKVSTIHKSSFFIDVLVSDEESGRDWHLLNVYESSIDRIRKDQWVELLQYRRQESGEWIVWGDFNDLLWEDEKVGGRQREVWTLRAFREFVSDLGGIDLGYMGYPFTWVNRRTRDGLIKERLDRVLVSTAWRAWYDKERLQHLFSVGSDHAALLLDTDPPQSKLSGSDLSALIVGGLVTQKVVRWYRKAGLGKLEAPKYVRSFSELRIAIMN